MTTLHSCSVLCDNIYTPFSIRQQCESVALVLQRSHVNTRMGGGFWIISVRVRLDWPQSSCAVTVCLFCCCFLLLRKLSLILYLMTYMKHRLVFLDFYCTCWQSDVCFLFLFFLNLCLHWPIHRCYLHCLFLALYSSAEEKQVAFALRCHCCHHVLALGGGGRGSNGVKHSLELLNMKSVYFRWK